MMNPELRRNLWLEITAHRLLAMPAILGLSFLALAAIDKSGAVGNVSLSALAGFGLLATLWGARLAANSIIDEMADKTWDWQRLSTLNPWTMTWGKLFGSTAFAWYGGLICLAVFLVTASATQISSPYRLALSVVLLTVILHAAGIAAALHTSRRGGPPPRRSIGLLMVFVLIYIVPFTMARAWGGKEVVNWYGFECNGLDFLLGSSAVFAAWAVIGAYRAMCQSLAVRTTPWVWVAFLLFVTAYSAGFGITAGKYGLSPAQALALAGIATGLIFTYVMLFTEPTGPIVLRRVAQKARLQQWRRAWQEMPCWPITWVFAAVCALILAGIGNAGGQSPWPDWAIAPLPFVLLAARDAGIFLFFAAAPQPKRVVGTTLVYMLLLDWMVPGLLNAFGLKQVAEMIFPLAIGNSWALCASALVQAGIAGWLAYRRMQVNFSSWRRADGS